jgi:hypothetical protein
MDARLLTFVGTLVILASSHVHAECLSRETCKGAATIERLLSHVPEGAAWQDLAPDLQAAF